MNDYFFSSVSHSIISVPRMSRLSYVGLCSSMRFRCRFLKGQISFCYYVRLYDTYSNCHLCLSTDSDELDFLLDIVELKMKLFSDCFILIEIHLFRILLYCLFTSTRVNLSPTNRSPTDVIMQMPNW